MSMLLVQHLNVSGGKCLLHSVTGNTRVSLFLFLFKHTLGKIMSKAKIPVEISLEH